MEHDFANLAKPSVIELDALLRDYLLGLVLIAGGIGSEAIGDSNRVDRTDTTEAAGDEPEEPVQTVEHPVQWVHVSDLSDPTPFLTPRTVILTTGSQFSKPLERVEAAAYVRRLREAGTTALGVGVGVQWDRIPPPIIEACERQQLPLFRVPYDTPFIAVVRTAARLIEAQAHADAALGREQFSALSSLARRRNIDEAEQAIRSAVLGLLLADHRKLADQVAAPVLPKLPRGQISVVCAPAPIAPRAMSAITPLAFETAGVFASLEDQRLIIITEHTEAAAIKRALTTHSISCGISERGSTSELPELFEQAERAAELALGDSSAGPVSYRPEMHAGVLRLLAQSPEAARRAHGLLSPLRQHDERHHDELLHSLTVWLAHHGQTSAAAAELGVHRHTLRTRVSTAENLLQRDFDNPDTRTELWAALRIAGHS